MRHINFANVQNLIVVNTTIAEWEFIESHPEIYGNSTNWIETDANTYGNIHYTIEFTSNGKIMTPDGGEPFRGNYGIVGYIFDTENDVFYAQQPYPSWTLNTTTWLWEAPVPMPTDGNYIWNEPSLNWTKIEMPTYNPYTVKP